jgi:hypothetical protein
MPDNPESARSACQDTASGADHEATTRQGDTHTLPWLKIALIAACLCVAAAGWRFYRSDISDRVETAISPAARSGDDDLAAVKQALLEERDKAAKLARELAMVRREPVFQVASTTAGDKARQNQQLTELGQALKQAEWLSATYQGLLVEERGRSKEFELELATRRHDQELLAQERVRSQKLEQQLATPHDDQALVAQERARSKALEQQLAARQGDQEALVQERARSKGLEQQLAVRQGDQEVLAQERARSKGLEQQLAARQGDQEVLAQERARSKGLEQQLAARQGDQEVLAQERARSKNLEQELAARQGDREALAQERARSKGLEQQLAARQNDQQLLARERARNQALEQERAKRRDATPDRSHTIPSLPAASELTATGQTPAPASDNPARPSLTAREATPMPALATDKAATAAPASSDKPVVTKPAAATAQPAPPQASGNPEAARLMARARLLLDQGDVGAARTVLERAAETGSASALFALAETYDPAVLSAWGTFGTQGDVGKAQQLYAEAFAGGVQEAKDRLKESR